MAPPGRPSRPPSPVSPLDPPRDFSLMLLPPEYSVVAYSPGLTGSFLPFKSRLRTNAPGGSFGLPAPRPHLRAPGYAPGFFTAATTI